VGKYFRIDSLVLALILPVVVQRYYMKLVVWFQRLGGNEEPDIVAFGLL
jgi:hypothetical protein